MNEKYLVFPKSKLDYFSFMIMFSLLKLFTLLAIVDTYIIQPMSLIVSSIIGDVKEQNSSVNKCLRKWLDSRNVDNF